MFARKATLPVLAFPVTGQGYIAALEGWRGVMALFVASYHLYSLFTNQQFSTYGYLGVDFFFILSGFIIARQYEADIATRRISFRQFTVRRLARLYPMYIFSTIVFIIINAKILAPRLLELHMAPAVYYGKGPQVVWNLVQQALMISNIGGMIAPWNGAAWSISVEWVVNVLFFILTLGFRRVP
ncbi:MAG: acyltransferase, partial [Pseudomonadota bacterium]|nr:acyltransferase [Pseudomonadota bacterium]